MRATFCFIDLEGFTAHTETHGDEDAADLAMWFAELTRSALGPGDRLVKTIGDAVLVTSPTAASAIAMIERLLTQTAREPEFPAVRAGLHHGGAAQRSGDVFGAAVNLAARVANEAHAGEVLGTEPIAEAARACGIPVAELGSVLLKNVRGTVPLFSLGLMIGAMETPIDPVCRLPVDRRSAAGRLLHRGAEYWFCSLSCVAAFASNPGWHAAEARDGVRSRS
jgi:class 3 adenylate cyclase/YHS domain-containing protein